MATTTHETAVGFEMSAPVYHASKHWYNSENGGDVAFDVIDPWLRQLWLERHRLPEPGVGSFFTRGSSGHCLEVRSVVWFGEFPPHIAYYAEGVGGRRVRVTEPPVQAPGVLLGIVEAGYRNGAFRFRGDPRIAADPESLVF